jgi:hypothetical protein
MTGLADMYIGTIHGLGFGSPVYGHQ